MAKPPIALTYVDHPEVLETYADSLEKMSYDGVSLRLEFTVHRPQGIIQRGPIPTAQGGSGKPN